MDLPQGKFGASIKKARMQKNLTQESLAELINITPMHMKQLESERRNPSVEVLYKIVQELDLSLDYLFSNPDDNTQEIRNKINLALNKCDEHELSVVYATIEALLKKNYQDDK